MKKILSLCVVFSMIISVLSGITASAAGTTVKMSGVSCKAGETVSVPITIENNTGFANIGITVEYDSSALTLKSSVTGSTGATFTPAQSTTVNPYNMGWDSTSNVTFNGTLATLEFEVSSAASGTYPLTINYYKGKNGNYTDGVDVNYDENFEPLNLSYVSGYVTVSEGRNANDISLTDFSTTDGITFKAKPTSSNVIDGKVIATVYNTKGILVRVKVYDASNEVDFDFGDVPDASMIKVMWWDSLNGLQPQAGAKTININ